MYSVPKPEMQASFAVLPPPPTHLANVGYQLPLCHHSLAQVNHVNQTDFIHSPPAFFQTHLYAPVRITFTLLLKILQQLSQASRSSSDSLVWHVRSISKSAPSHKSCSCECRHRLSSFHTFSQPQVLIAYTKKKYLLN